MKDGASSNRQSGVYAFFALAALLSIQGRYFVQILFSLKASTALHSESLRGIFRAPINFFDTTPSGQILNRFGKDIKIIDQEVINGISETVQQVINALVVSVLISSASPLLLLGAIPICKFMKMMVSPYFLHGKI